jgi:hypothetical protein
MKELLCVGRYSEWEDYPPLKIALQDLFRFWRNRCVVQKDVVDEILEDIFSCFTEKMRPAREEPEQMELTIYFDQVSLLTGSSIQRTIFQNSAFQSKVNRH